MNVPKRFWSKTVLTLVHLINRLLTHVLNHKSPLSVLTNQSVNQEDLRIFGCTYFIHIKRHDKFDRNALKIIFLEYSSKQKVTNILILANKNYISLGMSIFYKDSGDVNPKDFLPATLPELTLFEGTETFPPSELTSGGDLEHTSGGGGYGIGDLEHTSQGTF
jgi:hypothetical protein